MQYEQLKMLLLNQTELLSNIALGSDLLTCLNKIASHLENLIGPDARASILQFENQYLHHSAAPSLPVEYCQNIDSILVNPDTNPFTATVHLGKQVIIPDLEQTPFCDSFIRAALSQKLKACWSSPIFSSNKSILGIITIYYLDVRSPDDTHIEIMNHFTHLASLTLEKHRLRQIQANTQLQIEQLAFYDVLTNLPNRRLLMDHTQAVIQRIVRSQLFGALIYIDLNGFKRINDSLGHHIGDELLIAVSNRLKKAMRKTDTIARIGGDEFVVLIEDLQKTAIAIEHDANMVSNRILSNLEQYFALEGGRYKIDASIGVAIIDKNDNDAKEVLKLADAAMYCAKKNRHHPICFHNSELQEKLDKRLLVESEICHALENTSFKAFYQPQVDLCGNIIAAEALVRWEHPERGIVYPADFITVAEDMGVIHKIQETVLTEACETLNILRKNQQLKDNFRISINICPSQLRYESLPATLMKTINQYELSPNYFVLEITEGMLIDDIDHTIEILGRLRELGFKISIDDFGTGYSSLAYLNSLPVHEIKIDKSFTATLSNKPESQGIVDSVISLSKHFSFDVIAEGIEDAEQLEVIRQKGVNGLQGYLFAKPMNQHDFIDWISVC